jgi:hypothetical protein
VRRHFMPQMHRNDIRYLHVSQDAKTQIQRNVSWCPFYGNRTGTTRAQKIPRLRFMSRTCQNALSDPHISPNAKRQVLHNMSQRTFYENRTGTPEHEK